MLIAKWMDLPQLSEPFLMNMKESTLTFTGRIRSVKCALAGVRIMIWSQHNAWIHAMATVVVTLAGLALRLTKPDWCWIVLAIVSVWTAEALNTAFEFLTDVASPAFHPLAAKAKDVAAGAVLIAATGSVVIGILILGPYAAGIITSYR
jgi:diacylglycerol kinase (ATP)